ncbi:MAG: Pr6Pr family membrane protein [Acetobacteraceae bacterium]|nr:Pr6Pr family membrane protein [Acetobacteraceae bacterium]
MRAAAAAISAVAAVSLVLQLAALVQELGWGRGVFAFTAFFTILTNGLIAAAMARTAATGRAEAPLMAFLLVQIAVVALVWHLVLARMYHPVGLAWWADLGLHTLVPAGMAVFWWRLAPKAGLRPRQAALWLAWPLGFCAYAMARGAAFGWYPYFFLDPREVGQAGVAIAVLGLGLLFLALGLAVVALGRRRARG